nr:hypothetical protein CFP56_78898 [Quercus suber]
MTSLGMWACQWRELQPMMFGGNQAKASAEEAGDEPEGTRLMSEHEGSRAGDTNERGANGPESFEMSGMAPKAAV